MSSTNEYQILLDVVRQNFASVVWTHKIQIKQSLLSHRVEFVHPVSKETIVAEAPLPDDNLWRALNLQDVFYIDLFFQLYHLLNFHLLHIEIL